MALEGRPFKPAGQLLHSDSPIQTELSISGMHILLVAADRYCMGRRNPRVCLGHPDQSRDGRADLENEFRKVEWGFFFFKGKASAFDCVLHPVCWSNRIDYSGSKFFSNIQLTSAVLLLILMKLLRA